MKMNQYFLSLLVPGSELPNEIQLIIFMFKGDPILELQKLNLAKLCLEIASKKNTIRLIRYFTGIEFTIVRPPLLEFAWSLLRFGRKVYFVSQYIPLLL